MASGTAKVLLVEDDTLSQRMCVRELSGQFDTIVAANVAEALSFLDDTYDALITDYDLGGGPRGDALLVAASQRAPGCARILMSGCVESIDCLGLAHGYLVKPWRPSELLGVVRRLVSD
jgi:DNA-binding response OmpR family regulator